MSPAAARPRRFRRVLVLLGFGASALVGVAAGLFVGSIQDIPDIADLSRYSASPATKLFDDSAPPEPIAQLSTEQRTFVPLARIPRTLLDAVVAIEDERFFSHWGLDLMGIVRAMGVNLVKGRVVEGASTITQQLSRTLFLTRRRTLERKIKEAVLAILIERQYKKEEILEMYLNQIFFGHGAYGAEQAARMYFGKHVEELTLPESALLAGLPRAPNDYSPRNNPDKAVSRRNVVLAKMIDNGFVERGEAEAAMASPLNLRQTELTNAPYFAAHVQRHLEEVYGSQAVYRGGLSVYTTLDLRVQTVAQRALEEGLEAAETLIRDTRDRESTTAALRLQGALIALDPRTGAIRAMIGGRNFKKNQYNRATQARRQPGSAFKPFIYTTALLGGFTPADLIDDSPVVYEGKDGEPWQPSNYARKFYGPTPLRYALAFSRNVVTVKLLDQVGTRKVIRTAERFGFTGGLRSDLTLALGTSEVNLLELASAFSVFANGGVRAAPYSIKLVKDSHGNVLEQHRPEIERVVSPEIAYQMLSILRDTIEIGTAKVVRRQGFTRPAAGKTGTTDKFTDALFVGTTPELTCAVWIGYDDGRTMGRRMSGGIIAAPIWTAFMSAALEGAPPTDFERPEGLVDLKIDSDSGLLATDRCQNVRTEIFLENQRPTRACDRHDDEADFYKTELEQIERLRETPEGTATALTGEEEE